MYVPLMASAGVLKPRPTSLYQRFSLVETFLPPEQGMSTQKTLTTQDAPRALAFWKMGCFWNAFSIWMAEFSWG
jgi:hypothetical protein